MAKQSGLGSKLYVGTADFSGDVGAIDTLETLRGVFDVPAIDQDAMDRILGIRDGNVGFTSYWNTSAGQAHPVLSSMPRTDVLITVAAGTPAVGGPAASMLAKQTNYAPSRGQDGSLVVSTSASGNGYPLEWGVLLSAGKVTSASGSVTGTSVDNGASSAFGAATYLHVFSLGSGTPTLTIKDSADNSSFAALSPTSLAFSPTGAGVDHLVTGLTATVRRYVRVEISGTYTNLAYALVFVRYTESAA